jgi:hypothetical protein
MNQSDLFRERIKTSYDFDSWTSNLGELKNLLAVRFMVDKLDISGFEFESRRPLMNHKHSLIDVFRNKNNAQVKVAIEIMEFSSVNEAHETLVDVLSNCMATEIPTTEQLNINAGDVGFGGLEETQSSIYFVRRNVFVHVHNVGKERISVVKITEQVDSEILNHISK